MKYDLVPMAWVTEDTVDGQAVNGNPRRVWWENNGGVGMPIYSAPQPTPDVAGLVEALRSILGWRELRSGNDFPVERIEEIARAALAGRGGTGGGA